MPIASRAARLLGLATLGLGLALPMVEEAEAGGRRGGGQTQVGRGIGHHGGYRHHGRHHRGHDRHHRHHGGYAFYGLGLGFGLGALAYADPVYRYDPPAYYVPPAAYPPPAAQPIDPPYPPVPAYPPPVPPASASNAAAATGEDDPASWPLP
ncbi:MAG: hypothetical protein L6R19_20625 [Alphaproteobacteria bacterium]|nr:hypothetical protein [Alphaproteobacteria bacterium]